jgi:class 3 adenylate cyclase
VHRDLKKRLADARGEATFVIAVNVDIRGFSAFSQRAESVEAVVYLRRVYARILDEYFPKASFFKLTGDGLLLIFRYEDDNRLKETTAEIVDASSRLLDDFPALTSNDPMINFDVPQRVGIGIARGAASRMYAGTKTLDYSGRVLNLASRLMNLARPTGIVVDAAFDPTLLPTEFAETLDTDTVYLHGIAEKEPIAVLFTTGRTVIPNSAKIPIQQINWRPQVLTFPFKKIKEFRGPYVLRLADEPTDPQLIRVTVNFPSRDAAGKNSGLYSSARFTGFKYELSDALRQPQLILDMPAIAKVMSTRLAPADEVKIIAGYPSAKPATGPQPSIYPKAARRSARHSAPAERAKPAPFTPAADEIDELPF